jgi:hypothetical protein
VNYEIISAKNQRDVLHTKTQERSKSGKRGQSKERSPLPKGNHTKQPSGGRKGMLSGAPAIEIEEEKKPTGLGVLGLLS